MWKYRYRGIFSRQDEDDGLLARAVPPEWRRLPPDSDIIPKMQEACKSHILGWIVLLVILLPGLIWALVRLHFSWEAVAISAAVLLLIAALIVKNVLRRLFWQHPPVDLEYTAIDVAYCTEHSYLVNNGGRRKDVSLYYFLPDGRYRVVLHSQNMDIQPPECVYFIRLHGIVRWVNWEGN